MSKKNKDGKDIEEYLRYAKDSHGIPEEYEDWALDNGIELPSKKSKQRKDYDDSE